MKVYLHPKDRVHIKLKIETFRRKQNQRNEEETHIYVLNKVHLVHKICGSNDSTIATISYTYNDLGYRTRKTITEPGLTPEVTTYELLGDKVLCETVGTTVIYYHYDNDDTLISFNINGTDYFYIRNLQGDITAIIDQSRNLIVRYFYDAYGNINIEGTTNNPYTYRGYRFDEEIGLYYLNSRYYNPESGRFISSDGLLGETGDILSTNMYTYCINNPINNVDPSGYWVMSIIGFTIQIGAVGGGFVSVWWVFDNKGNHGILITAGVGFYMPQISVSYSPFFSWKKTIYDLQGISYVVGVGADIGFSLGADLLFDNSGMIGIQINIGVGFSLTAVEGHASWCVTALIPLTKMSRVSISNILGNIRRNLSGGR